MLLRLLRLSSQQRGRSQHCGSHASTHAESFEQDGFYFACVCVCVCLCVCVDDLTDLSKVTQHNRFVTKFVSESRGKEMSGECYQHLIYYRDPNLQLRLLFLLLSALSGLSQCI